MGLLRSPIVRLVPTKEPLLWGVGYGYKPPSTLEQAAKLSGGPVNREQVRDHGPLALDLLRTGPRDTGWRYFRVSCVQDFVGGCITRCREHSLRPTRIVLDDHGLPGGAFCGRDLLTLDTIGRYEKQLALLTPHVAEKFTLVLLHCFVAQSDAGRELCQRIARSLQAPGTPRRSVLAFAAEQIVCNGRFEPPAYIFGPDSCRPAHISPLYLSGMD